MKLIILISNNLHKLHCPKYIINIVENGYDFDQLKGKLIEHRALKLSQFKFDE